MANGIRPTGGRSGEQLTRPDQEILRPAPIARPSLVMAGTLCRMTTDHAPLFCDRCTAELVPGKGNFYVVNIEAMADPSPPNIDEEDLDKDLRREILQLIEEMRGLSQQELLDQVYRRATVFLCLRCFTKWIENPTG